jgi:hypothetical protein
MNVIQSKNDQSERAVMFRPDTADEPVRFVKQPELPPTAPHDPLQPDPSQPEPLPLPPDHPSPSAPIGEPDTPQPAGDPVSPEPPRIA